MRWKTTVLVFVLSAAMPNAARAERVTPPAVPSNLEVGDGHAPFLIVRATGTQNYICMATSTGVGWTFLGPQATLFGDRGEQVMTHFLSPNPAEGGAPRATWQHSRDSSVVWAVAIRSSTDPNYVTPGAIPWLLLQVAGAQEGSSRGDRLAATTFIQRVNTAGGAAPAFGCREGGEIGARVMVPYTTDYVFYRARQ